MRNPTLLIAAIAAYAHDLARGDVYQLVSPDEADDVSAARPRPPS